MNLVSKPDMIGSELAAVFMRLSNQRSGSPNLSACGILKKMCIRIMYVVWDKTHCHSQQNFNVTCTETWKSIQCIPHNTLFAFAELESLQQGKWNVIVLIINFNKN